MCIRDRRYWVVTLAFSTGAAQPELLLCDAPESAVSAAGTAASSTGAAVFSTGAAFFTVDGAALEGAASAGFSTEPDALPPSVSFMPGRIRLGFSPTTSRLSWYSFCQPPLIFLSAAIFAR